MTDRKKIDLKTLDLSVADAILGVDAGGTKTVALIGSAIEAGKVLARGEGGPANPRAVGFPRAIKNIRTAVDAALQNWVGEKPRLLSACFAVAGAGRSIERDALEWEFSQLAIANHVEVRSDADAVLAGGSPDGVGVAVIAGTGSIVVGRNPRRQFERAGGWGFLIGDEGSAYAVCLQGLRAVAAAADGLGPATSMTARFLERLQIRDVVDLPSVIYAPSSDRSNIAAMADIVVSSAASDAVARGILESAGDYLARTTLSVATRLGWKIGEAFPLSLAGSFLIRNELLRKQYLSALAKHGGKTAKVNEVEEPALGALGIAWRFLVDSKTPLN